jgi:predicted RNase H-like HicB family nuclease
MPSFPGAYSQGRTQAEAYRSLLLAIKDLIDAYVQLARPAAGRPRPRSAA